MNNIIKRLSVFLIFAFLTNQSFAGGVFDTIINGFSGATSKWQGKFLPIAQYIFWTISLLEFTYQLAFKKLLPGEINKLWVFVVTRVVLITLMAQFVLNINVYSGIIDWLIHLGALVGGVDLSTTGTTIKYSVSELWGTLWNMWAPTLAVLVGAGTASSVALPALGGFLFNIAFAILIVMLIMCSIVMLTLIEAYFVLFGGMFLMGFAGSSWTMNYWQKYLSYVAAVGVRLMFTSLVLGVLSVQWTDTSWLHPITKTSLLTDPGDVLQNLISMLGVFFFDMIILITFPSKAAAMLNGAVNAGLGEAFGAAAMAMSGGKMLGSPAAMAANVGKNVVGAVASAPATAKSAAFKAMRQGMKNNIGGSDDGGSNGKFRELMKSQGQTAASQATKSSIKDAVVGEKGNNWQSAIQASKQSASNFTNKAGSTGSGNSSAAPINANPHSH